MFRYVYIDDYSFPMYSVMAFFGVVFALTVVLVTQKPAFTFRHTSWKYAQDPAWRAKCKLNGSMTFIHGSIDISP